MEKVVLTLCYDGTRYHGWQVQPNGVTVQETVQDAVEEITGYRAAVTGCSRTDAGVHARRFYCTTDRPKLEPAAFQKALNAVLPRDVAVLDCRTVPEAFHPRYSATGKRYVYEIWNNPVRDPFREGYCWQVSRRLEVDSLNETARLFLGTHDFSAFCSSGSTVEDKVRTVTDSVVSREGDTVRFRVCADGFLYNMVRIFVGTLLDVESGRLTRADVRHALESGDRSCAGATAPAAGLYLEEVIYPEEAWI